MLPRIDAIGEELAGIVAPFPGLFEPYIRVDPQGKPFLLSLEAIFVPPPLPASRSNFEVKATIIE
jgi:hypothetical protein